MTKPPSFVDDSTECAICFDPLEGSSKPVITLKCGHKWHLECIVRQIRIGSMTASNNDKRLLFNGCQCGKCGSIFGEDDHPDLPKDLIRSTDKLRSKVNALIDDHNLLEGLLPKVNKVCSKPTGKGNSQQQQEQEREALYREARRKYAFYLCSHCKDHYFGGTIECADGFRSSLNESEAAPETRLCPACAPQSQTICQNPSEHGRYLTWKCRYCCRPSTHVCYGNVHFCDSCHDKHSSGETLEACLCPGEGCPYPKPNPSDHSNYRRGFHTNGPTQDCEQVYSCVLCDSLGRGTGTSAGYQDPLAIEVGSRNFLRNPSGEDGLQGWKQLNRRMSWQVEQGDRENQIIPPLLQTPVLGRTNSDGTNLRPSISTNFVSSFFDCAMAQTVDLREVLWLESERNNLPSEVRIEASARYTGRTDCPSVFALQAILSEGELAWMNNQQQRVAKSSGTLEAPPGVYWERTSLEFTLDTSGRQWKHPMVTVIVMGKDKRFWQGNFGSKVADITLRVVGGTPEELRAVVKDPTDATSEDQLIANNNDPTRAEDSTTSMPTKKISASLLGAIVVVFGVLVSWLASRES